MADNKIIPKKKEIDELVDSDGGVISGDRNVTGNSEIETGPVQKPAGDTSDYEKGMSTTTDRATRYRQDIPWFATYSYSGQNTRPQISETKKVLTKQQLEEEIKEDLVKKSRDGEVWDKKFDSKIEGVIDSINDTDLNDEQLEKIKAAIMAKLNKKNA